MTLADPLTARARLPHDLEAASVKNSLFKVARGGAYAAAAALALIALGWFGLAFFLGSVFGSITPGTGRGFTLLFLLFSFPAVIPAVFAWIFFDQARNASQDDD
jgi:hypothetical protein